MLSIHSGITIVANAHLGNWSEEAILNLFIRKAVACVVWLAEAIKLQKNNLMKC